MKAPTSAELIRLTQFLALRIGRYLERQGLLERDTENNYLAGDGLDAGPMDQLLGSSITYRIALGPQQGRKVFTRQTLPSCDEPFDDGVGKVAGFSLHAGVAARADERKKLDRLRRYISRPAVSEKRLSLKVRNAHEAAGRWVLGERQVMAVTEAVMSRNYAPLNPQGEHVACRKFGQKCCPERFFCVFCGVRKA